MAGAQGTGGPGYALNPFAMQGAQAQALRSYGAPGGYVTPGGAPVSAAPKPVTLAPHLSQAPTLDPDYMQAYAQVNADPRGKDYGGVDINRLWRTSPTAPIFKPGYQHSSIVEGVVGDIRERRRAAEEEASMAAQGYRRNADGAWIYGKVNDEGGWRRARRPDLEATE